MAYVSRIGTAKDPMNNPRHARLFRNGRNQAIRIPREMELPGDEVLLRKEGGRLIIEPVESEELLDWLRTLEPIEAVFPDVDEGLGTLDEPELTNSIHDSR